MISVLLSLQEKQFWRLISHFEIPQHSTTESKLGYQPSHTWRSVWGARELRPKPFDLSPLSIRITDDQMCHTRTGCNSFFEGIIRWSNARSRRKLKDTFSEPTLVSFNLSIIRKSGNVVSHSLAASANSMSDNYILLVELPKLMALYFSSCRCWCSFLSLYF